MDLPSGGEDRLPGAGACATSIYRGRCSPSPHPKSQTKRAPSPGRGSRPRWPRAAGSRRSSPVLSKRADDYLEGWLRRGRPFPIKMRERDMCLDESSCVPPTSLFALYGVTRTASKRVCRNVSALCLRTAMPSRSLLCAERVLSPPRTETKHEGITWV